MNFGLWVCGEVAEDFGFAEASEAIPLRTAEYEGEDGCCRLTRDGTTLGRGARGMEVLPPFC